MAFLCRLSTLRVYRKEMNMEKMTISASETSKRLGISKESTLRMLELGDIPAIRMGRNWLVPIKALDEWLMEKAKTEAKERREE